jgi:hypothetical protein
MVLDLLSGVADMHRHTRVSSATAFSKALEFARLIMGQNGGKLIVIANGDNLSKDPYLESKVEEAKRNYMLPSCVKMSTLSSDMHVSFICPSIFIYGS